MTRIARWLLLVGVAPFAGCNAHTDPPIKSKSAEPVLQEQPAPKPGPESVNRFAVAGFDDPKEVERFLAQLKGAVERRDRAALVGMVEYPLTYYRHKSARKYKSAAELSRDFDRVFTSTVFQVVNAATFDSVFVNCQGAMIGDGDIWFGRVRLGTTYGDTKIIAINDCPFHAKKN